ncbi:MAG: hypothetical protein AUJ37_02005 [Candidatus Magasanikbacteria bacterium CG1_02_41_34]|uniref:GTP-binding protein n=1 Tax=Candidatus Magasanikbacteria bacterium CG_4_10_14_0_2_um_filter_41_31 TaxID=1974639 RepID=A0A2M7V595_9BACT|nr:MAG: hypothetical protein AUJ37_02005 [Candidatus Magasanikbacteria bacterium CG1_02_41_34]PIZ93746.1 MAG: GTP-binding protein [Candidatus Magasanikbacteria bacterium CG_4_10_14_0_2_um_filter_41_31]
MFHTSKYYFPIFIVAVAFFTAGVGWQWIEVQQESGFYYYFGTLDEAPKDALAVRLYQAQKKDAAKPEKLEVKGIYLTAYTASNDTSRQRLIDLINATELNAVVIDIKDYTGYMLYDSNIDSVNELGTDKDRLGDVKKIVDDFHDHDIYVIARQTVFQDPVLAEKKHAWAIGAKTGGLWRDNKGLAWVDPTKEEVWQYNVDIAKEVIAFGFDEVQFDYVRFPSDGNMSNVVYTNGVEEKYDVMRHFYTFLGEQLADEPAWISLDMFGFVMERHDGMNIGQRLEDAVGNVDYISPMMYPSHYPAGHLGLANPAASPGIVIANGMQKGISFFEHTKTEVRPWIQAFNIGAVYGATNIRAQIDNVEKYTDGGWLLWNAANRYSSAGLESAE